MPARTDTRMFHEECKCGRVMFMKGMVKFLLDGIPTDPAPFPSMLVIFSKHVEKGLFYL